MYYILDENNFVTSSTAKEWSEWFEKKDRTVKKTTVGKYWISTVFIGLDMNYTNMGEYSESPIVFETMVFTDDEENKWNYYEERCSTWDQAIIQHDKIVKMIQDEKI